MNTNQSRAVTLAAAVLEARVHLDLLPERDWELLLLASGVNCVAASPEVVSLRVLANADESTGYFARPSPKSAGTSPHGDGSTP